MMKFSIILLVALLLLSVPKETTAATEIVNLTPVTPEPIEQFARFEVAFAISGSTYSNPYFPYDALPPRGLTPEIGVSVDALFLPPDSGTWDHAKRIGCFYFQPYNALTMSPEGHAHWRCRFLPDAVGMWRYKIQVVDENGLVQSLIYSFDCTAPSSRGFIRLSRSDQRFFEYSDGTPFVSPLITVQHIRRRHELQHVIMNLGRSGIRLVRWFPTTEEGDINLYGDSILSSWRYGGSFDAEDPDTARGSLWSYSPSYYSGQTVYLLDGQTYRLSFRANVRGEQVLLAQIGDLVTLNICSAENTLSTSCTFSQTGWHSYTATFTAASSGYVDLYMRGLYVSLDAPAPYNTIRSGKIRINDIVLQRDETAAAGWGPNLVTRGDADTHLYVDQNEAAVLDEILRLSELHAVYHKLPIFHKNDTVLNAFDAQGNLVGVDQCEWGPCPNHFYSGEGQMVRWLQKAYMRYFLARWSYSPAIHSLEYVNESDLYDQALEAGWMYARYVAENSSRRILTTNSFWGYWAKEYFADPTYGQYLDYSDQHWYANQEASGGDVISNIWDDSVANVRQCYARFKEYAGQDSGYAKPFVRGETGVAVSGTQPQDPALAAEPTGTYYHKKVWTHVGLLGYTCDGEWYPRIFEPSNPDAFPNDTYDIYKIYAAYDRFIQNEPLNNGTHVDLGTDLTGASRVTSSNSDLRAFGSKDENSARLLLWVDNRHNTWLNPSNVTAASGVISVTGMPAGVYTQETWDTRSGTYSITPQAVTVAADSVLRFDVSTSKDVAFKFYVASANPARAPLYLPYVQPR